MKQLIGRLAMRLIGWRPVGRLPDLPKMVVIGAPHTSNWDVVVMLPFALAIGAKITWMGKDSLFKGPLGWWFRAWGGFPVERGKRRDAVGQAIARIRSSERIALVLSPEGTRRKTTHWKSGFYHIARGANVPLVLGYLDYSTKTAGIGPTINLTGDVEADMARIRAFYADKRGRFPEQESKVTLLRDPGRAEASPAG
jgi:1-acyl-sn-glycerol-3-phosphate acyltransferase